ERVPSREAARRVRGKNEHYLPPRIGIARWLPLTRPPRRCAPPLPASRGEDSGASHAQLNPDPSPRGEALDAVSHAGEDDFAVLDLDEVDARITLAAFLAGGAGFLELDLAVHAGEFDLPQRRADCLRLGLARLGDGGRNRADTVIAAETLG